jgi:hypothetical protein
MGLYEKNSIGIYCIIVCIVQGVAFVCKHNGDVLAPGLQELNCREVFVVDEMTGDSDQKYS